MGCVSGLEFDIILGCVRSSVVEQMSYTHHVVGSSPAGRTMQRKKLLSNFNVVYYSSLREEVSLARSWTKLR